MSSSKSPKEILSEARNAYNSGKTSTYEFRLGQLKALLRLYEENTQVLLDALYDDLHKCKSEAIITEIEYMKNDVRYFIYNLKELMEPKRPEKPLANIMDEVVLHAEPYGVALIIGAWNYPIQLVFTPLAAAIAGGNCAIIKPSELATSSAKILSELVPKYLNNACYHVYNGGVKETTELLKEKFDYIFYTGSPTVGKIVLKAAAENLTHTTLELGGKSPVYLDDSVDMELAANRIVWGKFINCGQTCIAPDYLLCTKEVEGKFLEAAKASIAQFYGEKIKQSPAYGRIINGTHYQRILRLLQGAKIAYGGDCDENERYIQPTIVTDVKETDQIMQEEIFGPILPIYTINSAQEAIKFVNEREKPLALYIFSNRKQIRDLIIKNTSSGGVTVNDTITHFSCESLPFGGVGNSGMGAYHGQFGFDTFTHKKGALIKTIDKFGEIPTSLRYPPFTDQKLAILNQVLKVRSKMPGSKYITHILVFGLGVFFALSQKYLCSYFNTEKK